MSRGAPGDLQSSIEAARQNPNLNLGKIVLLEELGRGGMGVVYRGWQDDLRRIVAVKVLPGGADGQDRARFMREARVASKLRHPNIVSVLEAGEAGGRCFFTMDLVEGESFAKSLKDKRFDLRALCDKVRVIAAALDYAHQAGVVHRDIKPANILIDRAGTPFLTDFGLAQDASALTRLTMSGAIMGTPAYMSPEQAEGAKGQADPRTDIYSLGAVLYEGMTGRPPVDGGDIAQVIWHILKSDPARPSSCVPGIPRDLETICLKCLEKDPARRYATAGDLARDLEHFLKAEPIEAVPPATFTLWWLKAKRRPLPWVVASCAILLLGAGGAIWAQGSASAEQERLSRAKQDDLRMQMERACFEADQLKRKQQAFVAEVKALQEQLASAKTPEERVVVEFRISQKFAELSGGDAPPVAK